MKTILVMPSPWWFGAHTNTPQIVFEGTVVHAHLHTLKYSPELRALMPRFRLLEAPVHLRHCRCELVDEWPDAPEYWPPESAPKSKDGLAAEPKPAAKPKPAANQGRKAKSA